MESEEQGEKRRSQAASVERVKPRWSDIEDDSDVESLLAAPSMRSQGEEEGLRVCSLTPAPLSVGEERGGESAQAGRILGVNAMPRTSATWSDPQSGRTQGHKVGKTDVAEEGKADVASAAEEKEKGKGVTLRASKRARLGSVDACPIPATGNCRPTWSCAHSQPWRSMRRGPGRSSVSPLMMAATASEPQLVHRVAQTFLATLVAEEAHADDAAKGDAREHEDGEGWDVDVDVNAFNCDVQMALST